MKVSKNKIVAIKYCITDDDEIIVEDNTNFEPLQYLHGACNILAALERSLEGAVENETRSVTLTADQAYGNYDEMLVITLDIKFLFEYSESLEAGVIVESPDGRKAEILEVSSDTVVADYNHPLAGKQLHYTVTIISIRQATGEELLSGSPRYRNEACSNDCSCYTVT